MKDKILFVGGEWNLTGGEPSLLVNEFAEIIRENVCDLTLYNGGDYNNLKTILNLCNNYNIIFWWPKIPQNLNKIENVKDINFKAMLINLKENTEDKYSFQEMLQENFKLKANLTIEITKPNGIQLFRLFDPLGNLWYEGNSIEQCSDKLIQRLKCIKDITRQSTTSAEENMGALAWFFNMFKQEMYKSNNKPQIPIKQEFLDIVKKYANVFARTTFKTKEVTRFLGNSSFRCPKGFPSFREGKYIFVSKRNVNKQYITIEEFVPVYKENKKVYYCGESKPSVDAPIQVELYEKLPNINYMIHCHNYIKGAPYTQKALPCGAIEEIKEIECTIKENFNNDFTKELYLINLKGHGSIMMSKDVKSLQNIAIVGRSLPEKMF